MRPTQAPLGQQFPCFCGDTHPSHTRLFSMQILVCPEVQGPTLRLVQMTRTWVTKTDPKTKETTRELSEPMRHPGYLVVGAGPEPEPPEKVLGELKDAGDTIMSAVATLQTAVAMLSERVGKLERRREAKT